MKNIQEREIEGFQKSKIILSKLQDYEVEVHNSPLSIKMVLEGKENYHLNSTNFSVTNQKYLIVNQDSEYDISVQKTKEINFTSGICIYPPIDLVNEVYHYFSMKPNFFLEYSLGNKNCSFSSLIYNNAETQTGKFIQNKLPFFTQENNNIDFLDFYIELAHQMCFDQLGLEDVLNKLTARKKETKEELYRRLSLVKDYIHDTKNETFSIEELSEIACLSKYHLIRNFKLLYQKSPYQYLLSLKLEKAIELVNKGYSYKQITEIVGFSDEKNLRKSIKKLTN
ncbi:helix-turn-helix domain-containing protein [Aureivirga sp. CE67]|uniref:helix-turn-helix domain-containing protein n=1 Tax=Aureivirga sp. CE67 TaxID=1788983 RepID=UPI0018C8FD6A|nr:AraC family transcriptional regulator [Aureivirga sp. CE67]